MVARPCQPARALVVRSLDDGAATLLASGHGWQVHSVFQRALNLVASDGALLGVVQAPACNAPATLVVSLAGSAEHTAPFTAYVAAGMPARLAGKVLDIAGLLTLDVTTARRWTPAAIRPTCPLADIRARLRRSVQIAQAVAPVSGFAPLLDAADGKPTPDAGVTAARAVSATADSLCIAQARRLLPRLATAITAGDWTAVHDAARAFSGLGPGLTPAGDDLLAGLALGFRASRGHLSALLADALTRAVSERTTDLAVARVSHAVAGHPDESTHAVLAALLTGDGGPPDEAVRNLMDYGHSSGVDTLVGLVLGVRLGLD